MSLIKVLIIPVAMLIVVAKTSCQHHQHSKSEVETARVHALQETSYGDLPKPVGFLNDFENIFSDAEGKTLDSLATNFKKKTTIQIAILTIPTTMTPADSLDNFTLRVANAWGVGKKGKNNGVLIGISQGHRKMRIQNGYAIEKILSGEETRQIIDTAFFPAFRKGEFFDGTYKGLVALMAVLEKRYKL